MRAVIFSTGDWPGVAPLNKKLPAPLLHLVDRPFLQHVVEFCIGQGIKRFDFVLSHLPEKIEHFLGDGRRWGCTFTYHLARDPDRPYRLLHSMDWEGANEPVLLGHGDRLPHFSLAAVKDAAVPSALFCFHAGDEGKTALDWTGWALLTPEQIGRLPRDADESAVKVHLLELLPIELRRVETLPPLDCRSFRDLLRAHDVVLCDLFDGLLLSGKEVEPGVWLSRNVVLHPTAQVFPPVYIGETTEIGEGVKLGPNAVIGNGCVLDARSTVANSAVFSGSYVGEGLELSDVIVDKNRLINARVGGAVTITDNFILGNLEDKHIRRALVRFCSQFAGILALLLALPILLLIALALKLFRRGPVLHRLEMVRLPAAEVEREWRTFQLWSFLPHTPTGTLPVGPAPANLRGLFLAFLPALVNVARGELSFVGVPPRSRVEIKTLPRDWQALYLSGKAGIVTEAAVRCGPAPHDDELCAAETVYIASAGGRHDLKLLAGYLYRSWFGFGVHMYVDEPKRDRTPAISPPLVVTPLP